jgi:hypothetical protein
MDADNLHTLLLQLYIPLTEALPDAPRLQYLREHLLTMPGSYRAPKTVQSTTLGTTTASSDTAVIGSSIRGVAGATAVGTSANTALLPRVAMKATPAQSKSVRTEANGIIDTSGDNNTDMLSDDVDGDVSLVTVMSATASGTAIDTSSSRHMRSRVSRRYPTSGGIGSSSRHSVHTPALSNSQNGALQQQSRTATSRSSVQLATAIGTSDYVVEDTASAVKKQDWAVAASAALTRGDSNVDKIRYAKPLQTNCAVNSAEFSC